MNRYRKQWLTVGALCVGAFFLPIRFETDALFYIHLMDAAHLPVFIALTLFAHAYWPWEVAPCRRRLLAAGSMAGISAAIEIIQPLTGRSESFTDFVNGMMGILLALVLLASRRKLWALPLAVACVAVALQPAWREFAGMRWRAAHFPLLADFETDDELRLWIGNGLGNVRNDDTAIERVRQHATRGEWALRVVTTVSQWPGVRLLSELCKQRRADLVATANDLFDVVAKGAVKIKVNHTYALKDAAQAHRDLEARKTTGSIVLVP